MLDSKRLIEICNKMYEFDLIWIIMQPSMAILLVNCIQENDLSRLRSLKYMELTGEYLTDLVRVKLIEVFNCRICNQYGCNEANSIASEFNDNRLHCHSSNVYVEIIEDGQTVPYGTEGDIYITSLTNNAMPFIRYKIGDRGRLINSGLKSPILELTLGRASDFVIDEGNVKLPAYIFIRPIEHINEKIGNIIKQYQIIQNDTMGWGGYNVE